MSRLSLLLCVCALQACAFASTGKILKAASTVALAERADGEKHALYEMTRAREYLHKAREEYGYSDYEAAEKFAVEAINWGEKAKAKAADQDAPSTPAPPPTPPPAPASQPAAPTITPVQQ